MYSRDEHRLIDGHKLDHHPEWVRHWHAAQGNWELARTIYPLYVEIAPVGQCNHRCPWCAVDYIGYKNRMLDEGVLLRTFDEMVQRRRQGEEWNGVKSVMFAGEGEPTLHPRLDKIIIGAKQCGIDVALTTNGTNLNRRLVDSALRDITWIKVSLDSATPETHAINHHASRKQFAEASRDSRAQVNIGRELVQKFRGEFERILSNIRYACGKNRSLGFPCSIGAQLLLNPTNINEASAFVELVKGLGCQYCVIKPYSQHGYSLNKQEELFDGFRYRDVGFLKEELERFDSSTFDVVFRSQTMANYEDPDRHYAICQATPMAWGNIMATGEFISCSAYFPTDVGVGDQRFVLGNINSQLFQDIWEGDRRRQNWEFVNNELDITECRKNCRMHPQNRFLWENIKDARSEDLNRHLREPGVIPLKTVNFI